MFSDEELKRYGYAPGGYMVKCHDCGDVDLGLDKRAVLCRPCAVAKAVADIRQQLTKVGWTSVADAVPDSARDVLAYDNTHDIITTAVRYCDGAWFGYKLPVGWQVRVSHWMELPRKPEL